MSCLEMHFDNAIEAVRKIKGRRKTGNQYACLRQRRSSSSSRLKTPRLEETSVPEDGNLSTTKSDKNYHGYGIGSIRKIVETYNGSLSLRKMIICLYTDSRFCKIGTILPVT